MAFEYRFNVIRFYSKLNRFVLSPRKKPNHFVLKIRPGGFADYTWLFKLAIVLWTYIKKVCVKICLSPRLTQRQVHFDTHPYFSDY